MYLIMKLNIIKIKKELKRTGHTEAWLIGQAGVSRQRFAYWIKVQSIAGAERIAKVFDINPKDLLI